MTQTEAYIRAGYPAEAAKENASRLMLSNARVKPYCERLIRRKAELSLTRQVDDIMQPHEVKAELSKLGRADLTDFIDDNGKPRLSKDTPHRAAAKRYYRKTRTDRDGNPIEITEIQLHDKVEALRELAKIHGLYAPSKHLVGHVKVELEWDNEEGGTNAIQRQGEAERSRKEGSREA